MWERTGGKILDRALTTLGTEAGAWTGGYRGVWLVFGFQGEGLGFKVRGMVRVTSVFLGLNPNNPN